MASMFPSLEQFLGYDPGSAKSREIDDPVDLANIIETEILKRRPEVKHLTNGIHLDIVQLVKDGRLDISGSVKLHAAWVLGR